MTPTPEGTISARLRTPRPGGMADPLPIRFPLVSSGGVRLSVLKNPDATLQVEVDGLPAGHLTFAARVPPNVGDELAVAVTWTPQRVKLFVAGMLADSRVVSS